MLYERLTVFYFVSKLFIYQTKLASSRANLKSGRFWQNNFCLQLTLVVNNYIIFIIDNN